MKEILCCPHADSHASSSPGHHFHAITTVELERVRHSAARLQQRLDESLPFFLDWLYSLAPQTRRLLPTPEAEQHRFTAMLNGLGNAWRHPDWPAGADSIGCRHASHGVTGQEMLSFANALLATVERFDNDDERTVDAWQTLLRAWLRTLVTAVHRETVSQEAATASA